MTAAFKQYLLEKAGMSEQEYNLLSDSLLSRAVKKSTILLRQGEVCRHAFFVEKGLLRAYTISDSGKEHIVQFASENWFMSDRSSTYFEQPSDFFIEAIEDSELVLIDQHFVSRAMAVSEGYRDYNERILQSHIRSLQQRITHLLSASAEDRYLHFIAVYPDLTLRVPQWMIASYLGITPESLSRVRKELALRHNKGK